MAWSDYLTRVSAICLLLFCVTLAGCGAVAELILNQLGDNREIAKDERFCNSKCSFLKDCDDFRHCHRGCMSDRSEERFHAKIEAKAREKAERLKRTEEEEERAKFDKSLTDKILEGRSKL